MSKDEVRKSMQKQREEIQDEVKSYLNPNDRFAERMKKSLGKNDEDAANGQVSDETKELFVDKQNINMTEGSNNLEVTGK